MFFSSSSSNNIDIDSFRTKAKQSHDPSRQNNLNKVFKEAAGVYRNKESDIIIIPSRFESFSNVTLEAMGFGCIVILSDNIGMSEHINHGVNGFISNDEKELQMYLKQVLKDKDLQKTLGENARKTILERFSEDTFIKKWNEFPFRYNNFTRKMCLGSETKNRCGLWGSFIFSRS
jgi:glycosyltransferase involved in cell wall biosynthesis